MEVDKAVSVQNVISNHPNVSLQDKYFRGDSPKIQSLMVPIKPLKTKKASGHIVNYQLPLGSCNLQSVEEIYEHKEHDETENQEVQEVAIT